MDFRAGGERAGYGDIAVMALDESVKSNGTFGELMRVNNASEVSFGCVTIVELE